jgi:formylglycine-generating enzyme required for sulfatase activity
VSWGAAARFANWMHNGQPTGSHGPSTTETGAYALNGATTTEQLMAVTRSPGATWFIPTENEWYKAAYYQPAAQGGDSDGYWTYPMKTNDTPYSDQPPGSTPDNTRAGNFKQDDGIANGYDDGFAVTGSPTSVITQNYLTDVGAYAAASSYYGTFDQGGNLWEWNEFAYRSVERGIRGGEWVGSSSSAKASGHFMNGPTDQIPDFGFRLASTVASDDIGDFNHDGVVNAADWVLLRKTNAPQSDYNFWRSNFGQPAGTGTISGESGNVPEPSVLVLLAFVACTSVASRYR